MGQRKLIQWALAYVAAAFALIQVLDIVSQRFGWPDSAIRLLIIALVIGFFATLVLAWYHGERGSQRVSGVELVVLALLLALGGGWLWKVAQQPRPSVARSIGDGEAVPAAKANNPESAKSAAGAVQAKAAAMISEQSIAVLPLVNRSGDPANEYFSDGLSDELISVLASVPNLKLIGRNSSFHFKNTQDDSRTIGEKLGVAKLLEGSVRKQDNRVIIAVDLINAADSRQLWSNRYDRELKDIFEVQSEIAKAVVAQLKLQFGTANAMPQASTQNLDAYAALQRGDAFRLKFSQADLRKAVTYYNDAINFAPDYAVAHARLSRVWRGLAAVWLDAPDVPEGYARARREAEQALRLAPDLAEAHLALAWVLETPDFDLAGAEAEARIALQLAPGDTETKGALTYMLASRGKMGEALDTWHEALASNPFVASNHLFGTRILMGLGRYEEAAASARKAIEIEPSVSHAHTYLTMIALARGDIETAQREAVLEEKGFWLDFANTLVSQAKHEDADATLQRFIEQNEGIGSFQIASLYALRNDPDAMFASLDRAFVNKDSGLTQLLSDPFIARYRGDRRFAAICEKLRVDCSSVDPRAGAPALIR